MKISVVIPMYNAEKTILNVLDSVQNQTFLPHEIVIVNDGSTDRSLQIVQKYKEENKKIPIQLIDKKNGGVSSARNLGMKAAQGDWIALLDSDDVWHMDKLQIMSKYFDSGFSLLAHNFTLKPFEQLAKNPKEKIIFIKDILLRNCMVTPSIIMKKSLDFKFDENMKYAEDHELWLRIIDKEKKALFVDLPLVKLDRAVLSSGGASSNIWRMRKGEIKMYIKYFRNKSQYLFLLPFFITFSLLKFILTILKIKFLKSGN